MEVTEKDKVQKLAFKAKDKDHEKKQFNTYKKYWLTGGGWKKSMKLKWQKRNPYVRRVKNLDVHEEHVREEKQLFLHSLRFSYWGLWIKMTKDKFAGEKSLFMNAICIQWWVTQKSG